MNMNQVSELKNMSNESKKLNLLVNWVEWRNSKFLRNQLKNNTAETLRILLVLISTKAKNAIYSRFHGYVREFQTFPYDE